MLIFLENCLLTPFTNLCPCSKLLFREVGIIVDKETQILEYIKINPFISQQELAEKVDLSRSAVANYIANLTKRGEIKGRAYVLRENKEITCIGGANIDRKAHAKQTVRLHSSNPVTMTETLGGVARNVAENLVQLDNKVSLLTCVGHDKEGNSLLDETKRRNIDIKLTQVLPNQRTGTYTALLDHDGEMIVSLADMDIYDALVPSIIEEKWTHITSSKAIFIDTNIPAETIDYIIKRCANEQLPLYIDPVSSTKTKKLPSSLTGVEVILPNLEEAEELAQMKITSPSDYSVVADKIKARGVKNVVITLGKDGLFYSSQEDSGHLLPYQTEIVDVTGAGDSLTASILSSMMHGYNLKEACQYGLAAAALTVNTEYSVSPFLNMENINALLKENSQ